MEVLISIGIFIVVAFALVFGVKRLFKNAPTRTTTVVTTKQKKSSPFLDSFSDFMNESND